MSREKKHSLIKDSEIDDLTKIINTKYAAHLNGRVFKIFISSTDNTATAKVLLSDKLNTFHYPVEGTISHTEQEVSPRDGLLLLIDYIDLYFEEFFKDDESIYLPIDWSEHEFEGSKLYIRGQILNLERENKADEWLENRAASI